MKVLHLSRSAVAGAPLAWSRCMQRYGGDAITWSRCYSQSTAYKDGRSFKADVSSVAEAVQLARDADVIVVHNQLPVKIGTIPTGKIVLAVHSRPNQVDEWLLHHRPVGVIAQHHPGFYEGKVSFDLLPNLIDLEDLKPAPRSGPVRIGFSPSFLLTVGKEDVRWDSNKGYIETSQVLHQINVQKIGECRVFTGMAWRLLRGELPSRDIWIDECVTGSYHRCSLQAAALGQIAVNNASDQVLRWMLECCGATTHPFVRCGLADLHETLVELCRSPDVARACGVAAREWMERNWSPANLIATRFVPFLRKG